MKFFPPGNENKLEGIRQGSARGGQTYVYSNMVRIYGNRPRGLTGIAELGRQRLAVGTSPVACKPLTRLGVAKYVLPGFYYRIKETIAKVDVAALEQRGASTLATPPPAFEPAAVAPFAPTPVIHVDDKKAAFLLHAYASATKKTSLRTKLIIGATFVIPLALPFIPVVSIAGLVLINLLPISAARALGSSLLLLNTLPGIFITASILGIKRLSSILFRHRLKTSTDQISFAQIAIQEKIEPKFLARAIMDVKNTYHVIERIVKDDEGIDLINPAQTTLDATNQNLATLKQIVSTFPVKTAEIRQAEEEIRYLEKILPIIQSGVAKSSATAVRNESSVAELTASPIDLLRTVTEKIARAWENLQSQLAETVKKQALLDEQAAELTAALKKTGSLQNSLRKARAELTRIKGERKPPAPTDHTRVSLTLMNLDDSYEYLATIAEGGMGKVEKRRDRKTQGLVAVKLLKYPSDGESYEINLERFRREIQILKELSHPNVIRIFAWGQDVKSQSFFYVMELLDKTLEDSMRSKKEGLPLTEAVSILLQVAFGLQTTALKNIVHRDLKPDNIMLTMEGRVKVTDFGIAQIPGQRLTVAGSSLGTPPFSSPEQAYGRELDHRSDIFSLGLIFYYLSTKRYLFKENTPQATFVQVALHENDPASALGKIDTNIKSPRAAQIIKKMIAPKPEDRYQTYEELILDLIGLLAKKN